MRYKHNKELTETAKRLRASMTKEERHLWYDFLKDYPIPFYRQKVLGEYVVDFYCREAKLIIELDGSQHYTEENIKKDAARTAYLNEKFGLKIIRFQNIDINQRFEGVCMLIDKKVKERLSLKESPRFR